MEKLALISVFNKTGIVEFAKGLTGNGYNIIATGNTFKLLSENGISVTEIRDLTGFPEIFGGRVKTLHPKITGGMLMRRDNPSDLKEAGENGVSPIDIVCVNLYPFKEVARNPQADLDTLIENIDIGGPTMIRAAAKNYKFVSVITNPEQYTSFLEELSAGQIGLETRKKLAIAAFAHTADYDSHILNKLEKKMEINSNYFNRSFQLTASLRYGENPHQKGFFFGNFDDLFTKLNGKELSYNNLLDVDAAVNLMNEFKKDAPTFAILKHNNACGLAQRQTLKQAYLDALAGDPVSAFGGVLITKSNDLSL